MFTPSQLVSPGIPKQVDVPKPAVTEPPCLIMLGGLGDLLITLTVAWHYANKFGKRTPVLTDVRYQNVLAGCSYVKSVGYDGASWRGYDEAIIWARKNFKTVYPLHVGAPEIRNNPKTTHFCHEQYLHAGVPGRYGDFPLIFDRRNLLREEKIIKRVRDGRPLFLYNFKGGSSPLEKCEVLLGEIKSRFENTIQIVNTSSLDLSHYHDLLGLLDVAIGMISIDTSTIHLMAASSTPYIALVNDSETWRSSIPRGRCVLEVGYSKVWDMVPEILHTIDKLAFRSSNEVPKAITHPVVELVTAPHLLTIASGPMVDVWEVAKRTWMPWCDKNGLQFQTFTKLTRPDLHPSWNKIPLLLNALEKHSVVWWIDSDITVARPDSKLPSTNADMLFSTDFNGICAGMFRVIASDWVKAFFRAALFLGDVRDDDDFGKGHGIKWEQNAFKALLKNFPSCDSRISMLPTTFLNNSPEKSRTGDFYHFGACPFITRIKRMNAIHFSK